MHLKAAFTTVVALAGTLLTTSVAAVAQTEKIAPAQIRRIVVSIRDRKLALIENGKIVKIYRVAVGAEVSPSPRGEFTIVHRIPEPTYYAPGVVIPPGRDNPLGRIFLS